MEGKSLTGLLLVIPRFTNNQLTDPLLLACMKALLLLSTTEKRLPTATVLEHVVNSCSATLSSSTTTNSRSSIDKVVEDVKALSEYLLALLERYQAALHVGAELLDGPSCSMCLTAHWRDKVKVIVGAIKEQPSVWVRTHQLLATTASCWEMTNHFARMLPDQPTAGVLCSDILSPLVEAEMESACQAFSSLVDELCKDDAQRLVGYYDHDAYGGSIKLLSGSAWLVDVLDVTLRVYATGLTIGSLPNLLHILLLGIQTYTGRLIKVASKVPHSAPVVSWYVIINSLDHLCTRLSELHAHHRAAQSKAELGQVCRWVDQQCEAVVDRTISYHQQLCSTCLLHDAGSHDWQSSRPFCEGERVSYTVQAWHLHMKALLCDLTNHTPCDYITRITSSVLLHSLTVMADYYAHLQPTPVRMKQYRGDIAAILVIVGSLLPYLFPLNDTSPEFCLINKKCCSLTQALSSAGSRTGISWQQCVDWDHFELVLNSKISSLASLSDAQWGLLVELLLEKDCRLAVTMCRQGLLPTCALVLSHCHHCHYALTNTLATDDHSDTLSWVRERVGQSLVRPLLDTAVQFTVAMIHDTKRQPDSTSDGGGNVAVVITPLLIQLLSQLHTNIQQQLDKPMLILLASGLSRERSCSQLLGELLCGAVSLPDWLSERVGPNVSQWWAVFQRLLIALFDEREELVDYPVLYQCVRSDGVQEKLIELLSVVCGDPVDQVEELSDSVQLILHSTAADVVRSDEQGRQAMETILQWIITNKDVLLSQEDELSALVSPDTMECKWQGFDPVKTCCTLGNNSFDHQHFIS